MGKKECYPASVVERIDASKEANHHDKSKAHEWIVTNCGTSTKKTGEINKPEHTSSIQGNSPERLLDPARDRDRGIDFRGVAGETLWRRHDGPRIVDRRIFSGQRARLGVESNDPGERRIFRSRAIRIQTAVPPCACAYAPPACTSS